MKMRRAKNCIGALKAGVILLTVLACLKSVWVSLDIDESYWVAMAWRLARGDRPLMEMWEPHQFSAYLAALFVKFFLLLFDGTEYLVIYLRLAGILIHTLLGLALYRALKGDCPEPVRFLLLFLHLNFYPKFIVSPEFELMLDWFCLGIFLLLHRYYQGGGNHFLALGAGACLTGMVSCYPTMILVYPVYLLGICALERTLLGRRGWRSLTGGLYVTAGALLSGLCYLAWLLRGMALGDVKRYLSYLLMDTSHTAYTAGEKWLRCLGEIGQQARDSAWFWAAGLLTFEGILLAGALRRRRRASFSLAETGRIGLMAGALLAGWTMELWGIWGFLLGDRNQFYFQVRYMALLLPALLGAVRLRKRLGEWLYLWILPSLASVPAVLILTNMGVGVTYSKLFPGVMAAVPVLWEYGRELAGRAREPGGEPAGRAREYGREPASRAREAGFWRRLFQGLSLGTGLLVLGGLFVCRLVLIRVTGCLPVTVLAPLERMEQGPEAGIYVLEESARIWNDNYRVLESYVGEEDRLLYIGPESLIYVETGAVPATPTTQGTAVYNEMFLSYYEEFPRRLPSVIVIDKTFEKNPAYAYNWQNHIIFDWIGEQYPDARTVETDFLKILIPEDKKGL